MQRKSTRIQKAILSMSAAKWWSSKDIDIEAHMIGTNQSSSVINDLRRKNLLDQRQHPENKRQKQYRKIKETNPYLREKIAKAKDATTSELLAEARAAVAVLEAIEEKEAA